MFMEMEKAGERLPIRLPEVFVNGLSILRPANSRQNGSETLSPAAGSGVDNRQSPHALC